MGSNVKTFTLKGNWIIYRIYFFMIELSNQIYLYSAKKVALNSLYDGSGDSDAMIRLQTDLLPKAEVNSEDSATFFPSILLFLYENALKSETRGRLQCLCYSFTSSPTSPF